MYSVRYTEPHERHNGVVCSSGTEVHCGTSMCNYVLQERPHIPYNTYSTGGEQYTYGIRVCASITFKYTLIQLLICGISGLLIFSFCAYRKGALHVKTITTYNVLNTTP